MKPTAKKTSPKETSPRQEDESKKGEEQDRDNSDYSHFLSTVPPTVVAQIAATIPTPGLSAEQKIKETYDLLGLAKFWQTEAIRENTNPRLLIYNRENTVTPEEAEEDPDGLISEARAKCLECEEILDGLSIPFEKALELIVPELPTDLDRADRLSSFLKTKGKQSTIENYKEGFNQADFEYCYVGLRLWWKKQLSDIRSVAGSAPKNTSKGKQGQVLKPNDGRKGGRIPNVSKILKDPT
jgi:hypothetical protein